MMQHYIKIPTTLRTWFPGGAPPNWREIIFDDASARGTKLVLERIPPNAQGVRAALYGDRFYYEVGRDRDRHDTLFLMRIELADQRLPRSVPILFDRILRLWPGGDPSELDNVDELFGSAARRYVEDEPPQLGTPGEPSPLLLSLLSRVPAETRARFKPGAGTEDPEGADEFVQSLRRVLRVPETLIILFPEILITPVPEILATLS